MKSLSYISGFGLVLVLSIGLNGCGGGGGGTQSSTDRTLTGTFVDAPVQGINYSTATQSGVTDANGYFKYKSGETVEFKLGALSLGTALARELVTPYTLGGSTVSTPNTKTKNIAMLLQNLDYNRSNSGKIIITNGLKDFNFSNLDISSDDFENEVAGLLATAEVQSYIDKNNSLINTVKVMANMKKSLENWKLLNLNPPSTLVATGKTGETANLPLTVNNNGTLLIDTSKDILGGSSTVQLYTKDLVFVKNLTVGLNQVSAGNYIVTVKYFTPKSYMTGYIKITSNVIDSGNALPIVKSGTTYTGEVGYGETLNMKIKRSGNVLITGSSSLFGNDLTVYLYSNDLTYIKNLSEGTNYIEKGNYTLRVIFKAAHYYDQGYITITSPILD